MLLTIGQVTADARVHDTASAGEYLAALEPWEPRGAADKRGVSGGQSKSALAEESGRAQWEARDAAGV
jgi:hypothetical protein